METCRYSLFVYCRRIRFSNSKQRGQANRPSESDCERTKIGSVSESRVTTVPSARRRNTSNIKYAPKRGNNKYGIFNGAASGPMFPSELDHRNSLGGGIPGPSHGELPPVYPTMSPQKLPGNGASPTARAIASVRQPTTHPWDRRPNSLSVWRLPPAQGLVCLLAQDRCIRQG